MTFGLHTCVNAYEHTYTHICTHMSIPHAYPGSPEDELEEEERGSREGHMPDGGSLLAVSLLRLGDHFKNSLRLLQHFTLGPRG